MELYLIIQCGYEGIEKIFFPTHSKQEAIDKITERRNKISESIKAREDFIEKFGKEEDENYNDAWDRAYLTECDDDSIKKEDRKVSDKEYHDSKYEDPKSYCIQKWDEEKQVFKCVCKELNVEGGPTETWWM